MKSAKILAQSGIVGLGLATLIVAPVFACHPNGVINKTVEDVTTSSGLQHANSNTSALVVNSGDTLQYVVTVSNTGAAASNGDDDMLNTVLTDTLPSGVSLVSDPSETTITASLDTIKPGQKVTETYEVKVTSDQDGAYLTNKACFVGKSGDNNVNPQSGCDIAIVKVHVPPTPTPIPTPTPTPTPIPTPIPTPSAPTSLPNTGPGDVIGLAAVVTIASTAFSYFRRGRMTA